jgi:uncharacterized membrane protein YeaQ/YmgE (transglycosylase-associated protein family)
MVSVPFRLLLNFLIWILVGGLVGWLASLLTGTRVWVLLNVVVGIVGAFIAGLLLTPLLGISTINEGNLSVPGFIVSLFGAILLLAVVRIVGQVASRRRQHG